MKRVKKGEGVRTQAVPFFGKLKESSFSEIDGGVMVRKKYWILRLFFVLFTMSVSAAILPCGIINVHGLFGEVTAHVIVEDQEQEIISIKDAGQKKVQTAKGINILNIWFELLITVVCISFCADLNKLPRGDTIVTLKVRMDD